MKIAAFCFILFCTFNLSAQEEGIIKGNIFDTEMNNEPLLFADVKVKGSQVKTQTNFRGNFEINGLEPGSYILKVSFLGYETREIPVEVSASHTAYISEGLQAESISLSDVVMAEENTLPNTSTLALGIEK
ncbi:hypothetical protein B4Q04_04685 [Zobellia sp. OII3]|uniref:carboxypeptidase-like regulatory domain-containing protein n=1 Tax=Zobellia sp. OII3 TaxID=2034520 RepID=UPI000B52FE11|nr:carboxypeptidase-like regulatory domain-containing protein [Zobellia sp. OII3]OWW26977.1 hypothetical protein B4Q04_04685 [Zobellia sp. OII3]